MTWSDGGGSRTRTCEAYAGDLQSPPFAARDIPPNTHKVIAGRLKLDLSKKLKP